MVARRQAIANTNETGARRPTDTEDVAAARAVANTADMAGWKNTEVRRQQIGELRVLALLVCAGRRNGAERKRMRALTTDVARSLAQFERQRTGDNGNKRTPPAPIRTFDGATHAYLTSRRNRRAANSAAEAFKMNEGVVVRIVGKNGGPYHLYKPVPGAPVRTTPRRDTRRAVPRTAKDRARTAPAATRTFSGTVHQYRETHTRKADADKAAAHHRTAGARARVTGARGQWHVYTTIAAAPEAKARTTRRKASAVADPAAIPPRPPGKGSLVRTYWRKRRESWPPRDASGKFTKK